MLLLKKGTRLTGSALSISHIRLTWLNREEASIVNALKLAIHVHDDSRYSRLPDTVRDNRGSPFAIRYAGLYMHLLRTTGMSIGRRWDKTLPRSGLLVQENQVDLCSPHCFSQPLIHEFEEIADIHRIMSFVLYRHIDWDRSSSSSTSIL